MSEVRLFVESVTVPDGGYVEIEAFIDGPLPDGDVWLVRGERDNAEGDES